jgi:hypothetical protein
MDNTAFQEIKDVFYEAPNDAYVIRKPSGFVFDTRVRFHDKIVNIYYGCLVGIFAFIFILLIFYFVSLLRFRRPCPAR